VTAITERLSEVRPDELGDEFEIDLTPIWPADDERLEPIILAGLLWFEPEELDPAPVLRASEAPLPAELEEFLELDPQRGAEEPDEPPPAPRQRASATSLFGSLGVHLLPLLVLIGWSSAPAELVSTIPVQFVVEESSAGPADAPPDQYQPPRGCHVTIGVPDARQRTGTQLDRSRRMDGAQFLDDVRDEVAQVHRLGIELEATPETSARQIQDLFDHAGHAKRAGMHSIEDPERRRIV